MWRWTTVWHGQQKAVLVETVLFSMPSISQNDQQNSFSHWSIALLSQKDDLSVFLRLRKAKTTATRSSVYWASFASLLVRSFHFLFFLLLTEIFAKDLNPFAT